MARRTAGPVGRLCGVAETLGKEGSLWPTPYGAYGEDRAGRQADVHARAGRALRLRSRGARTSTPSLHDAGADRLHVSRGADQGDRRLRAFQVRKGRVANGRTGRVRAEPRLRSARRDAERINWRQEGVPR